MPQLYAGTSGFAYPAWKPGFYPAKTPSGKFLEYYAGRLNSVEINYTFRRLAAPKTLENWVAATPEGFLFAPKAHERITHQMKLRDAGEFTEVFLRSVDPLRVTRRLGPVLFQLPPYLRADVGLLETFLGGLERDGGLERVKTWRRAGTVRIKRQWPVATKAGKILPFHLVKE